MAKRNDIDVEDVTSTSQYDGMQVLKDAHSLPGHYIRTKESLTLVQSYFDDFTVTYNANGKPEEACYFAGTKPHLTTIGVLGDTNFSLAGTYIIISSGRKEARYAPYFVVDGVGNPPSITGVINIPVAIQENDDSRIVAFALEAVLKSINNEFKVVRRQSVLEVTTSKLGVTNNTIDGGTSFLIQNEAGTREEVGKVKLTYSAEGNPIWQSQELIGYVYNIYTGRFEQKKPVVNPDGSLNIVEKKDYDEFQVSYNLDGNIETVEYYLDSNLVRTITLSYNANGCLESYLES